MKILLAIDSLGSGGAQKQIAMLGRGLASRGHELTLHYYHPNADIYSNGLERSGVRILRSRKAGRFDLAPMRALRQELRRHPYDAAVAFLNSPSLYLLAARGGAGPPVIVSHRQSYAGDHVPFADRLRLLLCSGAKRIVANSFKGAGQIARSLPSLAAKLVVIPNGVTLGELSAAPRQGGRTVFLFVSRLSPEKNIQAVLEAMAMMRDAGQDLPIIRWAGREEMDSAGAAYCQEVVRAVARHGLSEYWQPLGERTDIPALLRESDALLLPSIFEGMPNSVCEALAAGRPVLASTVGDIPRLVQHGVSGLLFDPKNLRQIADTFTAFMRMTPEQRGVMGAAGRAQAEAMLSEDAYIDAWERCLMQVAGR